MPEALSLERASEHVKERAYWIAGKEQKKLDPAEVRCMDDRDPRTKGSSTMLPSFAIPGGTKGVMLDVVAAANVAAQEAGTDIADKKAVVEAITNVFGGVLMYHTDDMHGDVSPYCGCGYCSASLDHPEDNYLSEPWAEEIRMGVSENAKKLQARGLVPPRYHGPHLANAVMYVKGDNIGLAAAGTNGTHVYVVHETVRNDLLDLAARAAYPYLSESLPELSMQEWIALVHDIAGKRLGIVAKNLKADLLPQFRVYEEDGQIAVQELKPEPASEESVSV